jgi:hypothetical protein
MPSRFDANREFNFRSKKRPPIRVENEDLSPVSTWKNEKSIPDFLPDDGDQTDKAREKPISRGLVEMAPRILRLFRMEIHCQFFHIPQCEMGHTLCSAAVRTENF